MSRAFSEDAIVEQPVMEILSQDLAWEVANVYEGETLSLACFDYSMCPFINKNLIRY